MDDGQRFAAWERSAERLSARFPPHTVRLRYLWRFAGLPALAVALAVALASGSEPKPGEFPLPSVGFYLAVMIGLLPAGAEATAAVLSGCGVLIYAVYAAVDPRGWLWVIGHVGGFAALSVVFSIRFRRRARRPREIRG